MRLSVGEKIGAGYLLAIAIIVAGWAALHASTRRLAETQALHAHTLEVLDQLGLFESAIKDAETGVRGYIITGQPEFLAPYQEAQDREEGELDRIERLTRDNPEQQRRIARLRGLWREKEKMLRNNIETRDRGGAAAAAAAADLVQSGTGNRKMGEIRAVLNELRREENRLLLIRNQAVHDDSHNAVRLLAVCSLAGVLAILFAGTLVLRDITTRVKRLTQGSARIGAGDYAARIPEGSRDELGELTGAFNRMAGQLGQLQEVSRERDSFFTLSLDLICIAGFDGYFKQLNPAWAATLGHPVAGLTARPFIEFVHPDDRTATLAAAQGLATADTLVAFENRYRCHDGSYRWLRWNVRSDVKRKLMYAVARDVTEQKRSAAEIIRLNADLEARVSLRTEELARSNTELERFAYVASHDLQEPLRMVASYLQLLQRRYQGKLDADADEFIGFAVDGASRMKALINDLLALSRVGTQGKAFGPVDCGKILNDALDDLQLAVADSGAAVTHDPLPTVTGDEVQLTRLLQNLIGNAVKFRGDTPPRIHVGARREGGDWHFSVRDNGIGIDPQYFDRVFLIFQRLHGREEFSGTGIGLAVCKKIVERHRGKIWIESRPGEGATFHFTLPAAGARAEDPAASPSLSSSPVSGGTLP
jgi:PAS domain S-box-containing protein